MTTAPLIDAVAVRTREIVEALRRVGDRAVTAPSTLPGWNRLTIACHLRYGAVAFSRMTAAAVRAQPASYYPEGRAQQRPRTLEPEEGESPGDVIRSLEDESRVLQDVWSGLDERDWERDVVEPADNIDLGVLPLLRLPLLRLTEVEVHGTDLDLGLGDWSETFVAATLPFRLDWLNRRRTNHRAFDASVSGSWLLMAHDGPTYLVSVEREMVTSRVADRSAAATAVIEGSSRDVLALLLGRPAIEPLTYRGDEQFAGAFSRAFPGP